MRKNIYLIILFCLALFPLAASAQKIGKPTLVPTEATESQKQLIRQGVALHDQKKYDEAVKKYEQVLQENPNNDLALYEMALSLYNKKDFPKALETAYKLVQYKGKTGLLGYVLIANILDDEGKPKEAIEIYQKAIKQLDGDPEYQPHLSNLHLNLGVTYVRQKQYKEAREAMKKAVQLDFNYPSPHYMLAEIYQGSKYKVPAMLAAARFITMEINSSRSQRSVAIFLDTLKSAKKDEKTGNINIFLDFNAPKDEGDFGMYELILGTLTSVKDEKDKNKTEEEIFAGAVDTLIALLEEDKKLASTFVGKTYVPFMVDMKKSGYSKFFAYLVLQQQGNKQAEKWLIDQGQKTIDFINWAKSYQLRK
ncbi:MAG: tetratricopeptide repeat protein [Acidobacteriota bacterium]|nr:tetratricopeptide repeat protein [Acidobacteriota bacterium]